MFGSILPAVDCSARDLGLMPSNPVIRAFPLMCFSSVSWATPFHHYRVFRGVSPHVSLRKDYLIRLRMFVSQKLLLWTVVGSTTIQNFLLQLRPVRDLRGASDSATRGLSLLARHAIRLAGCSLPGFKIFQPVCCRLWLFRIWLHLWRG